MPAAAAEPPIADGPIQPREFQLIQNRGRANRYLNAERGPLETDRIDTRAWGAQWLVEKTETYVRFQNRWQTGRYLNLQNNVLDVAKVEPDWQSAMWTMESVRDGTYRICNRLQPDMCLHTQRGKLEAGRVDPKWQSAMWRLAPAPERNAGIKQATVTPKKAKARGRIVRASSIRKNVSSIKKKPPAHHRKKRRNR